MCDDIYICIWSIYIYTCMYLIHIYIYVYYTCMWHIRTLYIYKYLSTRPLISTEVTKRLGYHQKDSFAHLRIGGSRASTIFCLCSLVFKFWSDEHLCMATQNLPKSTAWMNTYDTATLATRFLLNQRLLKNHNRMCWTKNTAQYLSSLGWIV